MRRALLIALAALAAGLLLAAPASGTFHLMKISEVHTNADAGIGDFVELQMYAGSQNFVSGHWLVTYDNAGNQLSSFQFPGNVASGESQRTILVSDGPVGEPADFTSATLQVANGAGSVCFIDTLPSNGIDCVAYGTTAPPATNPSPVGTPALFGTGLGAGQSLTRSIALGCATLLEGADDTNDSANDFAVAAPSPRNNATAPTETACGGGGAGDDDPPQTKIKKHPKKRSSKQKAKFRFKADEPGASFECKFDRTPFSDCDSPATYKGLDKGKHKFKVRATDEAGNTDPSPAKFKFKVVD